MRLPWRNLQLWLVIERQCFLGAVQIRFLLTLQCPLLHTLFVTVRQATGTMTVEAAAVSDIALDAASGAE